MKKPLTRITDHAVVRYLERVCELDIEALRHELARQVDPAMRAGACAVVIDGFVYRLANGALVTIVRKERDTLQRKPHRERVRP